MKWWKIVFSKEHPFTDETLLIAKTESEALKKFRGNPKNKYHQVYSIKEIE